MGKIIKTCPTCGKDFVTSDARINKGRGKYCSKECFKQKPSTSVKLSCAHCGKEIIKKLSESKGIHYCSTKCKNLHQRTLTGEKSKKWIPKIKRICETCGKEFFVLPNVVKKGNGKFCSKKCLTDFAVKAMESSKAEKRIKCICETCGKEFYQSPSVFAASVHKHCSIECTITRKEIPCETCGKIMLRSPAQIADHNFCSRACYGKYQSSLPKEQQRNWKGGMLIKTCKYCGKEFETRYNDYCSKECADKDKIGIVGENHFNYNRIEIPCKQCGKMMKVIPSRIPNLVHGTFCSKKCRSNWITENISGEKSPCFKSKFVNCIICGTKFKLTPHWEKLGRTKYCSQECYWKDLPNLMSGPNHPNWVGGPKDYCEKWTLKFRIRIRAFFNNTCVECGTPQNGKLLHCHHVYYDKKACCAINENGIYLSKLGIKGDPHTFEIAGDPNKFVALCDSCHAKTTRKKSRVFYARHFEEIINTQYNGKSYYTKEEYELIQTSSRRILP